MASDGDCRPRPSLAQFLRDVSTSDQSVGDSECSDCKAQSAPEVQLSTERSDHAHGSGHARAQHQLDPEDFKYLRHAFASKDALPRSPLLTGFRVFAIVTYVSSETGLTDYVMGSNTEISVMGQSIW